MEPSLVAFHALGALALGAGLVLVSFVRTVPGAALALGVAGLSLAGALQLLGASLVAAVQALVTVVLVAVLLVHAWLLVDPAAPRSEPRAGRAARALGLLLAPVLLGLLLVAGREGVPTEAPASAALATSAAALGRRLFGELGLALQLLGLVLLAALLAAGSLVRRRPSP